MKESEGFILIAVGSHQTAPEKYDVGAGLLCQKASDEWRTGQGPSMWKQQDPGNCDSSKQDPDEREGEQSRVGTERRRSQGVRGWGLQSFQGDGIRGVWCLRKRVHGLTFTPESPSEPFHHPKLQRLLIEDLHEDIYFMSWSVSTRHAEGVIMPCVIYLALPIH